MENQFKGQIKTDSTISDLFGMVIFWFRYFLRRWWIIAIAAILGGLLGIFFATQQKPRYQSLLTFSLEDNSGGLGGALSLAADFGFNLGGGGTDAFTGENIITILTSRRIVESVLLSVDTIKGKSTTLVQQYIDLDKQPNSKNEKDKKAGRLENLFPVGVPKEKFTYFQDSILHTVYLRLIKSELIVGKPDRKLNLYEIKFVSLNERFSKVFTERLIAKATEFYTEIRTKRSKQTLEVLENRVASMRGAVVGSIKTKAGIQDANINPAFAQQSAQIQQKQMDISAYGGAYVELFKNLELARYQYLKDIPLLQIIDQPAYPLKLIKQGRLKTGLIFSFVLIFITIFFMYFLFYYKKFAHGLKSHESK